MNNTTIYIAAILIVGFAFLAVAEDADVTVAFANVGAEDKNDIQPAPGAGSIVDIAVADGRFDTLVAAVTAADLVDTLAGPGPFTVFAPTDAAFAKLGDATINALLNDIPTLTNILLYHVVPGRLEAGNVVELQRAISVLGSDLKIRIEDGAVFINDSQVVITDIIAANGVIHVIDTVLLPDDAADPAGTFIPVNLRVTNNGESQARNFLVSVTDGDRLVYRERINRLRPGNSRDISFSYVPAAAGERTLRASVDPYNLLPEADEDNNVAERNYTVDSVRGDDVVISNVMVGRGLNTTEGDYVSNISFDIYNVGSRVARDVPYRIYLTTEADRLSDDAILIAEGTIDRIKKRGGVAEISTTADLSELRGNEFWFWGQVNVGAGVSDANASNDSTIIGYGKRGLAKDMLDIVETAIDAGLFNTLVAAVGAADLVDTLRGKDRFTVFAPTDDAFAAIPSATLQSLLSDPAALSNILLYHVSTGDILAASVAARQALHMANGVEAPITLDNGAFIDDAEIVIFDIVAGNGIIHVIDSVITP